MQRKVKIGMVVSFLPDKENHGGVSYQVHILTKELSKKFDTTVIAMNQTDMKHNFKNIKLQFPRFLNNNRLIKILLFPFFIRFQDLNRFDVIHSHGDDYLFFFLRRPIIRTYYGTALGEMKTASSMKRKIHQFLRYFTEYLSGFHAKINVGISYSTKKYLPFIDEVIPCGIDLEKFKPGMEKSEFPSIFFVGTIKGRKRGWLLSKVFKEEIKPRISDAELWVVSGEKIEGKGIVWFGHVSESKLIELYQRAWVFCLPSSYEGFGVPYIEAMACGTLVVASPNSGAKEVLKNGKYGIITEDKFLGSDIVKLLENKRVRDKYVFEGLIRAKEFSWENVVKRYEKLYKVILKKS